MSATIGTSTLLDRQGGRRGDRVWLGGLMARPEARFLILVDGRTVVASNADRSETHIRWLSRRELLALPLPLLPDRGPALAEPIFLGLDGDGGGRFAVGIGRIGQLGGPAIGSADPAGELAKALPGPLVDLRSLAMQGAMPPAEVSLVGQALMLANWHATHRFCVRCGQPDKADDGGWKRRCGACGAESFPRIDPVVIMLVTDGPRAVLTREPRFPEGMWSTLAGFIEPGEDIAHAVRREVAEEIGIEVGAVRFAASQPWPFPHSLMIGCIAEAASFDLAPDPGEISGARWVDRAEMRLIRDGEHPEGIRLPGRQAIANVLVERWLSESE